MGYRFDSDINSQRRITVAVQAAQAAFANNQPFTINWTCQDNSVAVLSASELMDMPVAMALAGDALHQKARNLKALIDAATTAEEVQAVVW